MFGGSLDHLRTNDADNVVDKKIANIALKLQRQDKEYSVTDKTQQLERIKNLEEQAKLMEVLEKLFFSRMVRFVDRYREMLGPLEENRKKAIIRYKEVDNNTKDKVKIMEESDDKKGLKIVMDFFEKEKGLFEKTTNYIHSTEDKIKELKKIMNETCKESAYNAKDISKHTWM